METRQPFSVSVQSLRKWITANSFSLCGEQGGSAVIISLNGSPCELVGVRWSVHNTHRIMNHIRSNKTGSRGRCQTEQAADLSLPQVSPDLL